MKIVLTTDIKGLGVNGEVKQVSTGYAMNFLIPQQLAKVADKQTLQLIREKKETDKKKVQVLNTKLEQLKKKLTGKEYVFEMKAGESGKLYSGLSESKIMEKLRKDYSDIPESAHLTNFQPIKEAGEYKLKITLSEDIVAAFKVKVAAEK